MKDLRKTSESVTGISKLLICALLLTGCQLQVNFGSSVINAPVTKPQVGYGLYMEGSEIEDAGKDLGLKSDAKGSVK